MALINRKKRQAEKEAREAFKLRRLNEQVTVKTAVLDRERDAMFNSYCAIRNDTCTSDCVHCNKGSVKKFTWRDEKGVRVISPSCKLWRE